LLVQFTALEVATVSNALDACGLPPGQGGLRPLWGRPKVAGFAVTVELEPLSAHLNAERGGAHILTGAIAGAGPDDVIVVANGGRTDVSSWGGIVSVGAVRRSNRGAIIDGACRDVGQVELRVGGVALTVATAGRDGDLAPIVFLHGFGSTKEDYLDIACQHAFTRRPFHNGFLDDFTERARRSSSASSALYAASLRHKVRPGAVRGIFQSMVDLSDHGDLMATFLGLPCPRMFMYGEENSAPSYLAKLAADGVELAPIPHSGHWPMYANPVAMWDRIAAFIHRDQAPPPVAQSS
jgi:pimeloyl-ACP methyl ester carboxylesterase